MPIQPKTDFKPYRVFGNVDPAWSGIDYRDLAKPGGTGDESFNRAEEHSDNLASVTNFTVGGAQSNDTTGQMNLVVDRSDPDLATKVQLKFIYDTDNTVGMRVDSTGDLYLTPSGGSFYVKNGSGADFFVDSETDSTSILYFSSDEVANWSVEKTGVSHNLRFQNEAGRSVLTLYQSTQDIGFGDDTESMYWDQVNLKFKVTRSTATTTPHVELFQGSTGDSAMRFTETGSHSYIIGVDNSDSDKWKVSYGSAGNAALGTNDYLTIGTDGETIVTQWFQVGTATDPATQGDLAAGLTGAARMFYDQSVTSLTLYDGSGNADVVLHANGASYFNAGSLGIGTTGPDRALDVLDASNPQIRLTHTDGAVFVDLQCDSSGDLQINPSGHDITSTTNPGGDKRLTWANSGTTASDHSTHRVSVSGASGGDPRFSFFISGVIEWSFGLDNSDSDMFKLSASGALGTNDRMKVTGGGQFSFHPVATANFIVNEDGVDSDFRVEGDTLTNLLFTDGSADKVGINQSTPAARFHVTEPTAGNEAFRIETTATNDDPNYKVYQNRVATTDATVTTLQTIAITASNTYQIEARVQARRTGGTSGTAEDAASYVVRGTYKTVTGAVTLVGAVTADYTAEDQAGWDATLTISGTNVLVQVTGAANNNVTWHGTTIVSNLSS